MGRTWMFFLGGGGEGKRNSRARLSRRFCRTTRVPNRPMLYIIYFAVEVSLPHMSSGHREGGPRSSISLCRHMCCSASTTRRPSPHIEDGEGVVSPRSATDSTEQWVCCLCTCVLCRRLTRKRLYAEDRGLQVPMSLLNKSILNDILLHIKLFFLIFFYRVSLLKS